MEFCSAKVAKPTNIPSLIFNNFREAFFAFDEVIPGNISFVNTLGRLDPDQRKYALFFSKNIHLIKSIWAFATAVKKE